MKFSIKKVIFLNSRNICILPTHDVGRERYLTLLGALHNVDHKIGYRFLFFLKARSVSYELVLDFFFICLGNCRECYPLLPLSVIMASWNVEFSSLVWPITTASHKLIFDSVFDDERLTMYEDFVNASRGEKTLQVCLIEDLRVS